MLRLPPAPRARVPKNLFCAPARRLGRCVAAVAWLATAAGGLLATGCAVDQRKEVRLYRSVVDLGPAPPVPAPGAPLSLEQALRLANAYNERLSFEGEDYLQALIDRQRAAASLLPTLDLFATYVFRERTSGGTADDGSGRTSQGESRLFDAGIGAQYTLFSGFSNLNRVRAADATIEQRRWLLLDVREALLLETVRAYYAVLSAERLVKVLESSVAVQEERLRDVRGRAEVGFARPLDVAQIEAQASQTRVALVDARNQLALARSALVLLTGAEVAESPLTDGFELPATIPEAAVFLDMAMAHRQDLAAAESAAHAARTLVDAEIGRYYPTVTLNLDYFLTRDTVPTDRDWTGLLSVNLPLFSAGRIDADVRAAWSEFRRRVLDYSLVRRSIRRDVETAYENLVAAGRRLEELEHQLRAATEALRQAEAAYEAGLGTNLERVSAQDQVLSAQVRLASEEFNRKAAYLALLRATGALAAGISGAPPLPDVAAAPKQDRPAPTSPFLNLPGTPPPEPM